MLSTCLAKSFLCIPKANFLSTYKSRACHEDNRGATVSDMVMVGGKVFQPSLIRANAVVQITITMAMAIAVAMTTIGDDDDDR